jgi:glycine/D-amino acid oxidase-like deaminating enzyme
VHGFDTIVVGGGILGSATAYHLSRHGRRVLVIDQEDRIPNPHGSSADHAYIFRLTHGKDSFYTELGVKSLQMWKQLQHETSIEFLESTGMLDLAVGTCKHEEASAKVLKELKVPFQRLETAELLDQYRILRKKACRFALYHQDGGILWAQRAIEAFHKAALRRGSRTALGVRIVKVLRDKTGIVGLRDSKGKVWKAPTYVFAAGPWTKELLSDYGLPLRVTSQHMLYLRPPRNQGRYRAPHFPVFSCSARGIHGFPVHVHGFMKFGREKEGPLCKDVRSTDRPDPSFQRTVRAFLKDFFPDLGGFTELEDRVHHAVRTPDGDFILDRLPDAENAVVAVGFCGLAPMFAPLIGKEAAALLLKERPDINLHRFRLDRLKFKKPRR